MVLYITQTLTSAGNHVAEDMTQQAFLVMLGDLSECEGAKGAPLNTLLNADINRDDVSWRSI
ncbi:hypothetical protein E2C01_089059 [Portunus trituberculatus]|uniref:Uncharacterized protein n=1 Tax=Portunus trituberculatus TaxID=210409 RepID=A0A5B7JCI3_PORTR|nr:hypothetical protein [Portunus trituberculatus]